MAPAAAQGKPGDAGRGDLASGGGHAEGLGLAVKLTPGQARLCAGRAAFGIDAHALHASKVYRQSALADGIAGDIVAAAAHSYQEIVRAGEIDAVDHISNSGAAGNECR